MRLCTDLIAGCQVATGQIDFGQSRQAPQVRIALHVRHDFVEVVLRLIKASKGEQHLPDVVVFDGHVNQVARSSVCAQRHLVMV